MKFWVQCIIGFICGVFITFIPNLDTTLRAVFPNITETIRLMGRFLLSFIIIIGLPLSIIAATKRENKHLSLFRITGVVLFLLVCASFFGYLVGLTLVSDRLPPQFQEEVLIETQPFLSAIQEVFPANAFELLIPNADNILPLCVFAAFIAFIALAEEKHGKTSVSSFLEIAWSALWRMIRIGTSIGAAMLAVLTIDTLWHFSDLFAESIFTSLCITLSTAVLFISLGIFPAILSILRRENYFFQWYTSLFPPALFAVCSGDILYSLPSMYRSTSESLSFPHPIYSTRLILSTIFCRIGSVFVASMCCIVILRSYSALAITFTQSLMIILVVPVYALFMFNNPYMNVVLILSGIAPLLLGAGSSMHLILVPMFIILQRLASLLDCAGVLFILALKKERVLRESRQTSFSSIRHRILNEHHH